MLVTFGPPLRILGNAGILAGASAFVSTRLQTAAARPGLRLKWMALVMAAAASGMAVVGQQGPSASRMHSRPSVPPRVATAQRFLLRHGAAPHGTAARPQSTGGAASWQPLGPAGVLTANYGLVTGRISSLALDPSDSQGESTVCRDDRRWGLVLAECRRSRPRKHRVCSLDRQPGGNEHDHRRVA